jgi:hypothetical protein
MESDADRMSRLARAILARSEVRRELAARLTWPCGVRRPRKMRLKKVHTNFRLYPLGKVIVGRNSTKLGGVMVSWVSRFDGGNGSMNGR